MAANAGSTANSSAPPAEAVQQCAGDGGCVLGARQAGRRAIKDEAGWATAGHADRVVEVDEAALANFATMYGAAGTPPRRARLPALHAKTLLGLLEKLAAHPRRLGDLGDDFNSTGHWNETMARGSSRAFVHSRTDRNRGGFCCRLRRR